MYEAKPHPPIPRRKFVRRLLLHRVDAPRTDAGKVFAGLYAPYAGLVFLVGAGLIFAPVVHRVMHRFHWEQDQ